MKLNTIFLILAFAVLSFILISCNTNKLSDQTQEDFIWHGHSFVQLNVWNETKLETVIQIDPFNVGDRVGIPSADIVLITHSHYDHCSIEDIAKVSKPSTIVLAPQECLDSLSKLDIKEKLAVLPDKKYDINGIMIETVPAYTINTEFHPKSKKWVGYIVTINSVVDSKISSKKFYHAGDTSDIPEFASQKFADIDVAFLPIDGVYTMSGAEAALAANKFKLKLAIPIHYGSVAGTIEGAYQLQKLCDCDVEIPEAR